LCYLILVSLPSNKKNNIKLIRIPHLILRGLLSWLIFLSNKPYASDLKENYDCYSRNAHSVSCYYHFKDFRNWHSNLALLFVKLVFYGKEYRLINVIYWFSWHKVKAISSLLSSDFVGSIEMNRILWTTVQRLQVMLLCTRLDGQCLLLIHIIRLPRRKFQSTIENCEFIDPSVRLPMAYREGILCMDEFQRLRRLLYLLWTHK